MMILLLITLPCALPAHAFRSPKALCPAKTATNEELNRCIAYAIQGDYQQAISGFTKILETDQANGPCYYFRALVRSRIGEYELSLDDFDQALALDPHNENAYKRRRYPGLIRVLRWSYTPAGVEKRGSRRRVGPHGGVLTG